MGEAGKDNQYMQYLMTAPAIVKRYGFQLLGDLALLVSKRVKEETLALAAYIPAPKRFSNAIKSIQSRLMR